MKSRARSGFTLVELLIVIVVVAILAVVTATMYADAQKQARDTQLRDAADKVADAIQLFTAKNGHFPVGGWNSTTALSGTECTTGGQGWFGTGMYTCTLEDTLVASGYLPAGFSAALPQNTDFNNGSPKNQSIMVYVQPQNMALVFYAMESPTQQDTDHFNAQMQKCGINTSGTVFQRDSYGMRNAICFQY